MFWMQLFVTVSYLFYIFLMYCGILLLVIISDVRNFCLLFILMRFAKKLSVLLIFFKEPALDLADILLCLLSFSLVPYLSSLFFSSSFGLFGYTIFDL